MIFNTNDDNLFSNVKDPKKAIEILGLNDVFRRRSKSINGYTFTARQYRSLNVPYEEHEGYTPIVYLVACSSHSAIRVFNFYTNNGNVYFEALNETDSSVSSANFTIYLLYLKEDLMV